MLKFTGDFEKLKDYGFKKEVYGKNPENYMYTKKWSGIEIFKDRGIWICEGYSTISDDVYDLIKDGLVEKGDE